MRTSQSNRRRGMPPPTLSWRLLSCFAVIATAVGCGELPVASDDSEEYDVETIEQALLPTCGDFPTVVMPVFRYTLTAYGRTTSVGYSFGDVDSNIGERLVPQDARFRFTARQNHRWLRLRFRLPSGINYPTAPALEVYAVYWLPNGSGGNTRTITVAGMGTTWAVHPITVLGVPETASTLTYYIRGTGPSDRMMLLTVEERVCDRKPTCDEAHPPRQFHLVDSVQVTAVSREEYVNGVPLRDLRTETPNFPTDNYYHLWNDGDPASTAEVVQLFWHRSRGWGVYYPDTITITPAVIPSGGPLHVSVWYVNSDGRLRVVRHHVFTQSLLPSNEPISVEFFREGATEATEVIGLDFWMNDDWLDDRATVTLGAYGCFPDVPGREP